MTNERILELALTVDIRLVLRCSQYDVGAAYSASLEGKDHHFAITVFDLSDARPHIGKYSHGLWLRSTCYAMPLDELKRAAEFLGIEMPSDGGSAP